MNREEIIKGLGKIGDFFRARANMAVGDGKMLLLNWVKCAEEAAEAMRAQEPRVMTLEEAKSAEGYVWLECCDTPILRVSLFHDGYYIEPFEEPFRVDLMNWPDYDKEWRYWTSCPTDEQREATPWPIMK